MYSDPPCGYIKLNVDASLRDSCFRAGCGGVAGDHLEVELWALYHGVSLAIGRRERKILVESDSQKAINLLFAGCNSLHSLYPTLLMGYINYC